VAVNRGEVYDHRLTPTPIALQLSRRIGDDPSQAPYAYADNLLHIACKMSG
jgi:hypothetical protein